MLDALQDEFVAERGGEVGPDGFEHDEFSGSGAQAAEARGHRIPQRLNRVAPAHRTM
jgi:hypothetical protein